MTTSNQINRLVIVGGGSAGWMAASYLRKRLPPQVKITLIESPRVGTIGVGEGTIPIIRDFIQFLELDEKEWMTSCNATFKLGILFNDWLEKGKSWWHPFYFVHPKFAEKQAVDSWLAIRQKGFEPFQDVDTIREICMSWRLARENRCPRFLESYGSYENWESDHAYHFDATLFGQFLKTKIADPMGVETIVDHVTQVNCGEAGVESLETENHGTLAGDFFVDCTGFRRLLIGKVSSAKFRSFQKDLLCDRAVTIATPYQDQAKELRSYTVSTALSAGWVWQIGLYHRMGVGYVYSSQHINDEQAENELRSFLGKDRVKDIEARRISFAAGHLEKPWVKNCIAVGLSEGFVEPLEATSLGLTQHHLKLLGEALMSAPQTFADVEIEKFNSHIGKIYEEIRQFLVSHYCLTRRRDTSFWQAVSKLKSPLHEIQNAGHSAIPTDMVGNGVFATQSWTCLAAGLDFLPSAQSGNGTQPVLQFPQLQEANASQTRVIPGFLPQLTYLNYLHSNN